MLRTGTAGNDTFPGSTDSDSIQGSGGSDVLTYAGLPAGADLAFAFTALGSATITKLLASLPTGSDTVSGITTFIGGAGNDLFDLSGILGAPSITAPAVTIVGGAGNDTINAAG